MRYIFGGAVVVFVVMMAVGAVTGRVKARSCCAPADPALDRRMRAAFARTAGTESGDGSISEIRSGAAPASSAAAPRRSDGPT